MWIAIASGSQPWWSKYVFPVKTTRVKAIVHWSPQALTGFISPLLASYMGCPLWVFLEKIHYVIMTPHIYSLPTHCNKPQYGTLSMIKSRHTWYFLKFLLSDFPGGAKSVWSQHNSVCPEGEDVTAYKWWGCWVVVNGNTRFCGCRSPVVVTTSCSESLAQCWDGKKLDWCKCTSKSPS